MGGSEYQQYWIHNSVIKFGPETSSNPADHIISCNVARIPGQGLHVIEYTAYEAAAKERDELRKLLSQSVDTMRELMDIN